MYAAWIQLKPLKLWFSTLRERAAYTYESQDFRGFFAFIGWLIPGRAYQHQQRDK